MTQSELAQALGITQAAVSKLARRGMPTDSVERATRWRRRHLQTGRMKGIRRETAPAQPMAPEGPTPAATAPEDLDLFDGEDEDPDAAHIRQYRDARDRREHFQAEMARMAYEKECGRLMETSEVVNIASTAGTMLRTHLEQIPERLAPRLAGATDERLVVAILAEEIEAALAELSHQFSKLARDVEAAT